MVVLLNRIDFFGLNLNIYLSKVDSFLILQQESIKHVFSPLPCRNQKWLPFAPKQSQASLRNHAIWPSSILWAWLHQILNLTPGKLLMDSSENRSLVSQETQQVKGLICLYKEHTCIEQISSYLIAEKWNEVSLQILLVFTFKPICCVFHIINISK